MNGILVPTDLSENAATALKLAIQLGNQLGSQVYLLHVYRIPAFERFVNTEIYRDEQKKELLDHFKQFIESEVLPGLNIRPNKALNYEIREGDTCNNIIDLASEIQAEYIVMGKRGLSGLDKFLFGRNTVKVVKKSQVPVISVPAAWEARNIRNICFASDFDIDDLDVLRELITRVRRLKGKLFFAHIREGMYDWDEPTMSYIKSKFKDWIEEGILQVDLIKADSIMEGLEKYTSEHSIDMICMVKQRGSLLDIIFNRSVTGDFLDKSTIPLLIYHDV